MNPFARIAVPAVAVIVLIGGALYALAPSGGVGGLGGPPTAAASPTSSPSARASATSQATTALPSPSHAVIAATRETMLGPWRTEALALDPSLLAAIDRACRNDIPVPASAALVVADVRGGASVQAFYAGPDGSSAECLDIHVLPSGELRAGGAGGNNEGGGSPRAPLNALELRVDSRVGFGGSSEANIPAKLTVTSGQAGPGIASVRIEMPGQSTIIATLSNGWWAAAWPGPVTSGARVVGYDANDDAMASVGVEP